MQGVVLCTEQLASTGTRGLPSSIAHTSGATEGDEENLGAAADEASDE